MKVEIYAIFDSAVQAFLQPFFAPSTGSALRSLTDAVNDPKHEFSRHASDYTLFNIGSFDDTAGVLDPKPPERVVSVLELVVKSIN